MQVTAQDLERVRRQNLRISVAEFGAVWRSAETAATSQADVGVTDWSAGGVTITCRWLAGAVVESRGRRRLPLSPITQSLAAAVEELIEAEYLAAVVTVADPGSPLVTGRPGYVEAVVETLGWAWRHNCRAPSLASTTA